jgi:hypothetical protein
MAGASGRELAKCGEHGLHFDPQVHSGCVVCRRSNSLPPQPATYSRPPVGSVHPGGLRAPQLSPAPPSAPRVPRLWPVIRLVLAAGVLFVLGRMACRYSFNLKLAVGDVVATTTVPLVFAALPMVVRRYRSLAAFSWLLLLASVLVLFSSSQELSRPKPELEVEEWQMQAQSSSDGVITLSVPATWRVRPLPQGQTAALALASMRGNFAIVAMHEPRATAPGLDLNELFEAVKERYVQRASAQIGPPEATSTFAGLQGLKATVDGTFNGVTARGFVVVALSATHLHTFLVLGDPAYAAHLDAPLRWVHKGSLQ